MDVSVLDMLAQMSENASTSSTTDDIVPESEIQRWTSLSGMSNSTAHSRILEHRNDLSRRKISASAWAALPASVTAGHSKESWEFYCSQKPKLASQGTQKPYIKHSEWLLKLSGPLSTVDCVVKHAKLQRVPQVFLHQADPDSSRAEFVIVTGQQEYKSEQSLAGRYVPDTYPLHRAAKDLCDHSPAPTLGLIDHTLPQHRPDSIQLALPAQDQSPVWYFFYGTLACPSRLSRLLDLPATSPPELLPATIYGGKLRTWQGKYKALVNASSPGKAARCVRGHAYLVRCKDHEDSLRMYETDAYEVVRCGTVIGQEGEGRRVEGWTFRFRDEKVLD